MPRRLLAAAAAGALLLGLAACGDGGDGPVTTPPPEISIDAPSDGGGSEPSDGGGSETEEPTAAAPDIPPPDPADYAGMDEHTPEGAEQAFRYYIAVTMWAHQTGDGSAISNLHAETCISCAEFNDSLPQLGTHGKYWSEFTISDVLTELHESDTFEHEVGYQFTTSPHTRPNEDFSAQVEVGTLEYTAIGGMDWDDDHWLVSEMKLRWGANVH